MGPEAKEAMAVSSKGRALLAHADFYQWKGGGLSAIAWQRQLKQLTWLQLLQLELRCTDGVST